jgi:hypothetical protein
MLAGPGRSMAPAARCRRPLDAAGRSMLDARRPGWLDAAGRSMLDARRPGWLDALAGSMPPAARCSPPWLARRAT